MASHAASLNAIRAAKEGDTAAFEQLLRPMEQPAYRLACGLLHDPHAAEDAVQEAAIKAWTKIAQLREGSEMRPWFFRIVANECHSTRRSRWWSVFRSAPAEPELTSEAHDESVIESFELRRALRAMKPDRRLVLVLHFYLDLPVEEMAAVIGISPRGAETRLQRAINEMRKRMEAHRGQH